MLRLKLEFHPADKAVFDQAVMLAVKRNMKEDDPTGINQ